ncbi:Mnd1-like protein [Teratosphaeria nubilosa]|uniref:Meiotic nuclear division protein 1 n=1 Tax=Teratosphaeria nubilosa TaxID=161662 RepID=A0A6G1KYN9_9PEZI|nr:Mnd1-like protein [Teratosphaeria nubilosa]
MAPKTNCNPLKMATMTAWFQKSRVAHNIKDLEKMLPSVGSISGMQVKDYLQALQDENKINVEKIGSGNWYWSFISQDKKTRQAALAEAQSAHDKQAAINTDLEAKVAEAQAQRADEEDMLDGGGDSREELMSQKAQLEMEVNFLRKELSAYSDSDPTELERKRKEMIVLKGQAEQFTDEILAMEGWLKDVGQVDGEQMLAMKMDWYDGEFDEEEGGLRELV